MDPEVVALLERIVSVMERYVALQPQPDTWLDKLLPALGIALLAAGAGLGGALIGSHGAGNAAKTAAQAALKAAEATARAQQRAAEIAGAAQRVNEHDRALREWRRQQVQGLLTLANGRGRLMERLLLAVQRDHQEEVEELSKHFRAVERAEDSLYFSVDDPDFQAQVKRFTLADTKFTNLFMHTWAERVTSGDRQKFSEESDRVLEPAWQELGSAIRDLTLAAERYVLPPPTERARTEAPERLEAGHSTD